MEKKILSSPVVNNPSFLHDNFNSEKYMTLDRLALKRSSLPLRLMPKSMQNHYEIVSNNSNGPIIAGSYSLFSLLDQHRNYTEDSSYVEKEDVSTKDIKVSRENIEINDVLMSKESTDYSEICCKNSCEKQNEIKVVEKNNRFQNYLLGNGNRFVTKPKGIFPRNVFRSMVMKRSKYQQQKLSKSDVIKDNSNQKDLSDLGKINHRRSVSLPTNLSQTNDNDKIRASFWSELDSKHKLNDNKKDISVTSIKNSKNKNLSPESEISRINGMNVSDEATLKNEIATLKPQANSSFLWSNKTEYSNNELIKNIKSIDNEIDNFNDEKYDDVGFLSSEKDGIYDDVGVPLSIDNDDQIYDDVIFQTVNFVRKDENINKEVINSTRVYQKLEVEKFNKGIIVDSKINNCLDKNLIEKTEFTEERYIYSKYNYSSIIAEDADDEDNIYDDVEYLGESRINSIYVESNFLTGVPISESEWVDMEDISFFTNKSPKRLMRNASEAQSISFNVKKPGHKWSMKVRQQRSKASRKNSRRSANRVTRRSTLLDDSDSCDSNYETLSSYEPVNNVNNITVNFENLLKNSEENIMDKDKSDVPSKPVPPTPKESSLTETFGKKMKMLKRTWSITKGSLGRMRKKTSIPSSDIDSNTYYDVNDPNKLSNFSNNIYERKSSQVFNFKKHFQRSNTSSSVFYVNDKINDEQNINDIYENINQYNPSNYSSSLENNADDYNLLDEEPLYQFYAAATVKGAFKSDSDSYAETDDSTSLGYSSLELIKPGQRTLWCQTPQVINSGLLDKLSTDKKKLQEAKFEIVTSEASYLNSLRVIVNEFLINHELVYESLTANDREILFGNVPKVLMASEKFLSELEYKWKNDIMLNGLADILLKHAEMSADVYIKYCSNQVSMDLKLKELKEKKCSKFMETVTRIESYPACQNLSLHSFLMLPMQRITRLPLLADAVLSKLNTEHEERLHWEKVLSVLSGIVKECNEGARKAGRQIEMDALSRKLEYPVEIPPIDLKNRYLIRSGPATHVMFKSRNDYKLTFRKKYQKILYLLLFTDHLLIAKLKSNGGNEVYSIVDSCRRNLIALEKVSDESPMTNQHTMILTLLENYAGKNVEYFLTCKNDTERERWVDAVTPQSELVGETLYETWDCPQVMALFSYVPIQPDELSLQPGDVINVLRKMVDGWNLGEKLVSGEQGWFPSNYTKEVLSEHVRAKNLRQRHRLLALTENFLQHHAKQITPPHR